MEFELISTERINNTVVYYIKESETLAIGAYDLSNAIKLLSKYNNKEVDKIVKTTFGTHLILTYDSDTDRHKSYDLILVVKCEASSEDLGLFIKSRIPNFDTTDIEIDDPEENTYRIILIREKIEDLIEFIKQLDLFRPSIDEILYDGCTGNDFEYEYTGKELTDKYTTDLAKFENYLGELLYNYWEKSIDL